MQRVGQLFGPLRIFIRNDVARLNIQLEVSRLVVLIAAQSIFKTVCLDPIAIDYSGRIRSEVYDFSQNARLVPRSRDVRHFYHIDHVV